MIGCWNSIILAAGSIIGVGWRVLDRERRGSRLWLGHFPVLDVAVDEDLEGVLETDAIFGAGLKVCELIALCQCGGILEGNSALVDEVGLVADEDGAGECTGVHLGHAVEPIGDLFEGALVAQVKDKERGISVAEIVGHQAAELFLASSVPDGKIRRQAISGRELDAAVRHANRAPHNHFEFSRRDSVGYRSLPCAALAK